MPEKTKFDLVVIGAGPGGYVAAIRAAQLGLSVGLIDKREALGGTCLNIGCIPSKALLDSSELFSRLRQGTADHGILAEAPRLDLSKMMERKSRVVEKLTSGLALLMKARKISVFTGTASVPSPGRVTVTLESGKTQDLEAGKILLATGSTPQELPFLPFDGKRIVSSEQALSFASVPKQLIVVGAGAIGLELGSVWLRLGSKVTVVEIMPAILPGWDRQVSETLRRELAKQGFVFEPATGVTGFEASKNQISLKAMDKSNREAVFKGDRVLVAVGRRPFLGGIDAEALGIKTDRTGRVEVDESFQTSTPGIYAIGDLIPGPMLAHKAEDEGVAVAELLAGKAGHVNYDIIPGVVYTWPEAASVGQSEEQLKERKISYRKGSFPFRANGRALASGDEQGFVKILADERTDRVLGAHIVGPWASTLISEAVTVMEFGGSSEDIARTVHAHPTLPEVVKEAALAVDGRPVHGM